MISVLCRSGTLRIVDLLNQYGLELLYLYISCKIFFLLSSSLQYSRNYVHGSGWFHWYMQRTRNSARIAHALRPYVFLSISFPVTHSNTFLTAEAVTCITFRWKCCASSSCFLSLRRQECYFCNRGISSHQAFIQEIRSAQNHGKESVTISLHSLKPIYAATDGYTTWYCKTTVATVRQY